MNERDIYCWFYQLLRFLLLIKSAYAVAKFETTSVSTSSIVIKMISASNVSRFEMDVTIYDLDRLREYRKTELSVGRHDDQLFSFDGLLPNTWFAIRIEYRLYYHASDGGYSDFPTKQELIVRTKNDTSISPSLINDKIIFIDGVITDDKSVNVTVSSSFASTSRLSTLIVPELRCLKGSIKPPAQKVFGNARIHFDLQKISYSNSKVVNPHCSTICVFPFVRAEILDSGQHTFRGKEWCGSLQEAIDLMPSSSGKNLIQINVPIILTFSFLFLIINF